MHQLIEPTFVLPHFFQVLPVEANICYKTEKWLKMLLCPWELLLVPLLFGLVRLCCRCHEQLIGQSIVCFSIAMIWCMMLNEYVGLVSFIAFCYKIWPWWWAKRAWYVWLLWLPNIVYCVKACWLGFDIYDKKRSRYLTSWCNLSRIVHRILSFEQKQNNSVWAVYSVFLSSFFRVVGWCKANSGVSFKLESENTSRR